MADLSGFTVAASVTATSLICSQCAGPRRDGLVWVAAGVDPTLTDLVAAANRHTRRAHRPPRL